MGRPAARLAAKENRQYEVERRKERIRNKAGHEPYKQKGCQSHLTVSDF
jgi:hypothetical protein